MEAQKRIIGSKGLQFFVLSIIRNLRIFNKGGKLRQRDVRSELKQDWNKIGQDFNKMIHKLEVKNGRKRTKKDKTS